MNVSQVKFKKNTIISEEEPNIVNDGENYNIAAFIQKH